MNVGSSSLPGLVLKRPSVPHLQSLGGGVHLYQFDNDSIDATWEINDGEGDIIVTYFALGSYPGGDGIFPATLTSKSYIPSALMRPAKIGTVC